MSATRNNKQSTWEKGSTSEYDYQPGDTDQGTEETDEDEMDEDDDLQASNNAISHYRGAEGSYSTQTEEGTSNMDEDFKIEFPIIAPIVELGAEFVTAVQKLCEENMRATFNKIRDELKASRLQEEKLRKQLSAARGLIEEQRLFIQCLEEKTQTHNNIVEESNPKDNMGLVRDHTNEEFNALKLSCDELKKKLTTLEDLNKRSGRSDLGGNQDQECSSEAKSQGNQSSLIDKLPTPHFWNIKLMNDFLSGRNAPFIKGATDPKLYHWDGKYWCDQRVKYRVMESDASFEEGDSAKEIVVVDGVAYLESRTDKGMLRRLAAKADIEFNKGQKWLVGVIRYQVFVSEH